MVIIWNYCELFNVSVVIIVVIVNNFEVITTDFKEIYSTSYNIIIIASYNFKRFVLTNLDCNIVKPKVLAPYSIVNITTKSQIR